MSTVQIVIILIALLCTPIALCILYIFASAFLEKKFKRCRNGRDVQLKPAEICDHLWVLLDDSIIDEQEERTGQLVWIGDEIERETVCQCEKCGESTKGFFIIEDVTETDINDGNITEGKVYCTKKGMPPPANDNSVETSPACDHEWIEEWGGFKTTCRKCGYVDEEELRRQIESSY